MSLVFIQGVGVTNYMLTLTCHGQGHHVLGLVKIAQTRHKFC